MPSLPSASRLIASQVLRTSSGVSAEASPKMWGCRRTSFVWIPAATSPRSYRPSSSATQAKKYTWKRRSPSSPQTAASPRVARCADGVDQLVGLFQRVGDDVSWVCLRSQGQSRRRRRVRSYRRSSSCTTASRCMRSRYFWSEVLVVDRSVVSLVGGGRLESRPISHAQLGVLAGQPLLPGLRSASIPEGCS